MKIYRQFSINKLNLGGLVGFEFKMPYKLQVVVQQKTLGILRIELLSSQAPMNQEFFEDFKDTPTFENLPKASGALLEALCQRPQKL